MFQWIQPDSRWQLAVNLMINVQFFVLFFHHKSILILHKFFTIFFLSSRFKKKKTTMAMTMCRLQGDQDDQKIK